MIRCNILRTHVANAHTHIANGRTQAVNGGTQCAYEEKNT